MWNTQPEPHVRNVPAPAGYIDEYDSTIWNTGFVFWYSFAYDNWVESATITVRPGQSGSDALTERTVFSESNGYRVFFSEGV